MKNNQKYNLILSCKLNVDICSTVDQYGFQVHNAPVIFSFVLLLVSLFYFF